MVPSPPNLLICGSSSSTYITLPSHFKLEMILLNGMVWMNSLEELEVIKLCLLEGQPKPTLLVLHQDSHEKRHLRTYTINIKDKTLDAGICWTH
jgi:hypothetical protein